MGMWWAGITCAFPLMYFPMRGPMTIAPASAMTPPMACTTPEPAKSTAPWPHFQLMPDWASQPPPHTQLAYTQ